MNRILLIFIVSFMYATNLFAEEDKTVSPSDSDVAPTISTVDTEAIAEVLEKLDGTFRKLALQRNASALELINKKNYPEALKLLSEAHDLAPQNSEIAANLGYVYFLLGNLEQAEQHYRQTLELEPDRYVTVLNLAELLAREGETEKRIEEARALLVKARELKGNLSRLILLQARAASLANDVEDASDFYREYSRRFTPEDPVKIEIGDFFAAFGHTEDALDWYGKVKASSKHFRDAKSRIREMELNEVAKKYRWSRPTETISPQAKLLATKGRILLDQGRFKESEKLLQEAIVMAPASSEARINLGDLMLVTDRSDAAELAYLRALSLDSGDSEIHERLAALYMKQQRSAEAALQYLRAIDLKPDWLGLHIDIAKALRASGDFSTALKHIELYLSQTDTIEQRHIEAIEMKNALGELTKGAALERHGELLPSSTPKSLYTALGRARAHLSNGDSQSALLELHQIPAEQRNESVLNLEAQILMAAGRHEEAIEILKRSSKLDNDQTDVHMQLGLAFEKAGLLSSARTHYQKAFMLGESAGGFYTTRLDLRQSRQERYSWDIFNLHLLQEAKESLEIFAASTSKQALQKQARTLAKGLGERIIRAWATLGVILASIVTALFIVFFLRTRGVTLGELIEKHPDSGPEVQRVLSAIRHEVLKHNTMILSSLVAALERGDEVADKAIYLYNNLFGSGDDSVVIRFADYVKQLDTIGRAHGTRLNLLRKDTAISSIAKGFKELKKCLPKLATGGAEKARRAILLADLNTALEHLNVTGYEKVRVLLERLRTLEVDRDLLEGIWRRVQREPAFENDPIEPLVIDSTIQWPANIAVPRQDFEDIIANIVRNAISSSVDDQVSPLAIALGVDADIDGITGLERVIFSVKDKSSKSLSLETLRNRLVEQGLGLTSELVSKYDGNLDVRREGAPWTKAVIVELPRVESGTKE